VTLSIRQAAYLVDRDEDTVRRWIRSGQLRAVRVRGRLYVDRVELVHAERSMRLAQAATRITTRTAYLQVSAA
jgi:excisionase family DNA binding protein